jgi:histidinol-phosphatase
MRVSSTAEIDRTRVAVWPPAARPLVVDGCRVVQASALHLVDVLRGAIDGYVVACCHAWDHAPWILLVEEAGGRFTDWSGGGAPDQGGGIFSNSAVHPLLIASMPTVEPPLRGPAKCKDARPRAR